MNIQIIAVGKIKEKYLRDAVSDYSSRLKRFVKLSILEVSEEQAPQTLSIAEEEIVKKKEAQRIVPLIAKNSFVIVLDLKGEKLDSVNLSKKYPFG